MSSWFDYTINGVIVGNVYALVAVGLALIFGVSRLINFAQGSIYLVGAYVSWVAVVVLRTPLVVTVVVVAAVAALVGLVVERFTASIKIILGLVRPRSGELIFDGASILDLTTPQIVRRGIASVPEARRVFADRSVRENILMGAFVRHDRGGIARDCERVLALFPKLGQRLPQRAGSLSGGEQQRAALARALMSRPRMIVMDEPTMGLSPLYVDRVLELIGTVNEEGVSIFMVEQNASFALEIARPHA